MSTRRGTATWVKSSIRHIIGTKVIYSILKCDLFLYIWSDYGDEIVVDKGQKLTKWCPSGKVSQRLSMKERGAKVLKEKKKIKKKGQDDKKEQPKGLYTRESEAQLMLQAMAFNEKVIAKLIVIDLFVG